MRISLLRFKKKIHKFALCEFMPYALNYFIFLVRFFGYFCPIWLMRIFFRTKSRIRLCRISNKQGKNNRIPTFFYVFSEKKVWNIEKCCDSVIFCPHFSEFCYVTKFFYVPFFSKFLDGHAL